MHLQAAVNASDSTAQHYAAAEPSGSRAAVAEAAPQTAQTKNMSELRPLLWRFGTATLPWHAACWSRRLATGRRAAGAL